jgi:hypothetical protein
MKTLTQNETARIKAGEPMATRSSGRLDVRDQYKLITFKCGPAATSCRDSRRVATWLAKPTEIKNVKVEKVTSFLQTAASQIAMPI